MAINVFLFSLVVLSSVKAWRFTLSELLDKPWTQMSSLLPPGTCLHFYRTIGSSIPTARRFRSNVCYLTPALAVSAINIQFVCKKKTSILSVRLEPTKLILVGTQNTDQGSGDARKSETKLLILLPLLVLQARFADKPHRLYVIRPQDGTAVLKGVIPHPP